MAREKMETSQPAQAGPSPQPQGSDRQKPKKNGIGFGLFAFLTAIIIISAVFGGAFYIVINNNVNGLGEKYRKEIQKYAFVRWMLPPVKDPEDPKYLTQDQILQKYNELRKIRDELKKNLEDANSQLRELQKSKEGQDKQVADDQKLKKEMSDKENQLKDQQKKLEDEKKKLDEMIAKGDKTGFKDYFEKLDKEAAQKIYADIIKEQKATEDDKKLAQMYESMDPSAAAEILEQMGISKIDFVVGVVKNMKKETAAEILANMDPSFAGRVSEKMKSSLQGN